ncbi:MAG: hypothetical protein COA66_00795 [Arcobacter sp.]|nr:MAG: hypothetical protein COA66_00795 [Arcobacter sp.]
MSKKRKILILYLLPFLSLSVLVLVYMHAYGKYPEDTFINSAFSFIILGFILSCFITINLFSMFLNKKLFYTGIIFSIFAFLLEVGIVCFYLLIFYDVFTP